MPALFGGRGVQYMLADRGEMPCKTLEINQYIVPYPTLPTSNVIFMIGQLIKILFYRI